MTCRCYDTRSVSSTFRWLSFAFIGLHSRTGLDFIVRTVDHLPEEKYSHDGSQGLEYDTLNMHHTLSLYVCLPPRLHNL